MGPGPLAAVVVVVLVLLGGSSRSAAAATRPLPADLTVGVGDQKLTMFTAPLFLGLGLTHVRRVIPWDVMQQGWQRDELKTWMDAASAAGMSPLLTFGHSRRPERRTQRPSPTALLHEFHRLRAAYPWVRDWGAWNEPNHCGELLCKRPELAARYYDALRRACPDCRILAAEVLDLPNMVSWVRRFRRAAQVEPRYWGLHNYVDANRMRTSGTRALIKATRGQVWFTETGGIVSRTQKVRVPFPESAAHAGLATRWLFDRLVPLSPRIKRVYLYHWNAGTPVGSWDSGLVNAHGAPRVSFRVLQARLAGQRDAAATAAALAGR